MRCSASDPRGLGIWMTDTELAWNTVHGRTYEIAIPQEETPQMRVPERKEALELAFYCHSRASDNLAEANGR